MSTVSDRALCLIANSVQLIRLIETLTQVASLSEAALQRALALPAASVAQVKQIKVAVIAAHPQHAIGRRQMIVTPPSRINSRVQLGHILLTMQIEALKDHALAI